MRRTSGRSTALRIAVTAVSAWLWLGIVPAGARPDPPAPLSGPLGPDTPLSGPLGPWNPAGERIWWFIRSQGLASDPAEPSHTVYSSQFTLERADVGGGTVRFAWGIPIQLLFNGYEHVGDIDVHDAKVYAPFEGPPGDGLFGPTLPPQKSLGVFDAATLEVLSVSRHNLDPGETDHNSWVTVTPDGAHVVAGEWDDMTRFLVFPTPAASGWADVDPVAEVLLDSTVSRIQGCDFSTPTNLVCASDDGAVGKPVYSIDLDAAITGSDVHGAVANLGPVPQQMVLPILAGVCGTDGETEGVDVSGGVLRILVIDPCLLWVHEHRFEGGTPSPE